MTFNTSTLTIVVSGRPEDGYTARMVSLDKMVSPEAVERYVNAFGVQASVYAQHGHEALRLMAESMANCGMLDG